MLYFGAHAAACQNCGAFPYDDSPREFMLVLGTALTWLALSGVLAVIVVTTLFARFFPGARTAPER